MAFDRDFAPEPAYSDEQLAQEHSEMVKESTEIEDIVEHLRLGGYSPREAGELIKHEIDQLEVLARERLEERAKGAA